METSQEISIKTEIKNEPTIDLKVDEENKTGEKECEQVQVIKEPKIQIQSLYCYSCHQHFESLSLFKSHRHGDEEEDEENCCLDVKDLDGLSVTCHKCDAQFLSLRLFLDHLYRKTKRKKKRKILDNSNLNSDWQSAIRNNSNNNNNNNEENLIETDEEINIDDNNNSNSSADFSGSENNNSDNEHGNEIDPEFDPLDVDEDFNLNRETEDEDQVSVQSYYENEEEEEGNEESDDDDDEEFSPTKSKLRKKSTRPIKKKSNTKKKKAYKILKNNSGSLYKKAVACGICGLEYSYKYVLYRHIRKFHVPDFVPYTNPDLEATLIVNCGTREVKTPTVKAPQSKSKPEVQVEVETEQNEMENPEGDETGPESESGSGSESESDNKLIKASKKKLPSVKKEKEKKEKRVNNPKNVTCIIPMCNKKYSYKYKLHRHLLSDHSADSLNIHWTNRKQDEIEAAKEKEIINDRRRKERVYVKVQCPEEGCGKILSCAQALRYHRVVHLKKQEKPIPTAEACKYCGKVFPLKCYLRQHVRQLHEIYKPILCDKCPMTFQNRAHLKEHSRSHSGERPYLCSYCPLTFSYSSTLHRHMLTHADRNYKCDFEGCGKAFRMKQTLLRHQRQHTGLRPYKCKFQFPDGTFCNSAFMDNKPLKTHYAQAHPDFSFARVQHENKAEPISTPVSVPNPPPQQQQQPQFVPNPIPVWTAPRD